MKIVKFIPVLFAVEFEGVIDVVSSYKWVQKYKHICAIFVDKQQGLQKAMLCFPCI